MGRPRKSAEALADKVFTIADAPPAGDPREQFYVFDDEQSARIEQFGEALRALSQLASSEIDELHNAGGHVEFTRRNLGALFGVLAKFHDDTIGFERVGQVLIDPREVKRLEA